MKIDLLLDSDASSSEVAAVTAVVQEEGICGTVETTWASRGLDFPWVIALLVPLGVFVNAFFSNLGKEAARDAYPRLRQLVCRLSGARRNSNGVVELWDDNSRTHIILTADLPSEAYEALAQKGFEQLKGGYWVWDSDLEDWTRF